MSCPKGIQESQTNSLPAGKIETNQLAQELMEGKHVPVLLPNNHPAINAQPLFLNQYLKEWQKSVTSECRKHLIHRFIVALFPTTDPSAMLDKRMNNLVEYAKTVEGNTYSTADSRSEYFHLIAEKIYKIQRELEEKRAERKRVGQNLPTSQTQTSGTFSNSTGPRIHGGQVGSSHATPVSGTSGLHGTWNTANFKNFKELSSLAKRRAKRKHEVQMIAFFQSQTPGTLANNTGPRILGVPAQRMHGGINQTPNCSLSTHQAPACSSIDQTAAGETMVMD